MTGEGEQKLACLKNVEQIEEAVFLLGKIKQKMDELQSGILFCRWNVVREKQHLAECWTGVMRVMFGRKI